MLDSRQALPCMNKTLTTQGLWRARAGTVVAMADNSHLHPIAKLLVGFPCVEHTGPLLDVIPAVSTENKGIYMAKVGWQSSIPADLAHGDLATGCSACIQKCCMSHLLQPEWMT